MDIDSDLSNESRNKVISYVQNKFGEKAVCGIITMNAQAPRGAVQIAAKYFGFKKYGENLTKLYSTISKDIPDVVGVSFATTVNNAGNVAEVGTSLYEYLRSKYASNADALGILDWARIIEGSFTAYSAHAAGIVISDNGDVSEYLPLRANSKLGLMTTQCNMVQVEEAGLLKFDFLGLKTLDIITGAIKAVEQNFGVVIDPLKIDLNDTAVYKNIFSVGKTNSVFQFESDGMKSMLKRFKPESFEDLILLVAAYRPGPMQYLDDVIYVKSGIKPVSYITPELEPILSMTYGATIYQEQVMEICQKLAGYSLGQADNVRRFMSKKKVDKLAHEKESFIYGDEERGIPGCVKNGISKEAAETIFEQMMEFAKYAFNKSHAAAYAFNAYITAWLKNYYPAEFFASALNWADNDSISGLVYEAKSCNVKVLTPDINISEEKFVAKDNYIRFGLSNVAGVKKNAKAFIDERGEGFKSMKDFIARCKPKSDVLNALILSGAMDAFSANREALKDFAERLKSPLSDLKKKKSFIASATLVLPNVETATAEELVKIQEEAGLKAEIKEPTTKRQLQNRISNAIKARDELQKTVSEIVPDSSIVESKTKRMKEEYNLLGTFVSAHPLDYYPTAKEVGAHKISVVCPGQTSVYGVITRMEIKKRKKDGKEMVFFTLEDRLSSIEAVVFVKEYEKYSNLIEDGNVVVLSGKCEEEVVEIQGEEEGASETKTIKKIFVKKVSLVQECPPPLIMTVKSLYLFHLDVEKDFVELYRKKKGHKFFIKDLAMNEIREMDYQVSDDALLLDAVELYSF